MFINTIKLEKQTHGGCQKYYAIATLYYILIKLPVINCVPLYDV